MAGKPEPNTRFTRNIADDIRRNECCNRIDVTFLDLTLENQQQVLASVIIEDIGELVRGQDTICPAEKNFGIGFRDTLLGGFVEGKNPLDNALDRGRRGSQFVGQRRWGA